MVQEWVIEQLTSTQSTSLVLAAVFVYSVLLAVALPFPAEFVFLAVFSLGLPRRTALAVVMVVAASGNAFGSLFAQRLGYGVSRAAPVTRLFQRVPGYARFRRRSSVAFVRKYRYVGLTAALSIPFLPVTATLYAFSVLEDDPWRFAATVFVATLIRLSVFLALVYGGIYVLDDPRIRRLAAT